MAATYTLKVEAESPLSNNVCRYCSSLGTEHLIGSVCWASHQLQNNLHLLS